MSKDMVTPYHGSPTLFDYRHTAFGGTGLPSSLPVLVDFRMPFVVRCGYEDRQPMVHPTPGGAGERTVCMVLPEVL